MSCDVGEVTERLENELCYDYNYKLCSFSKLSVTSSTSQLIFQPFRRFTYVTAHSATIPLLHLRHSSLSNPSFAPPTSQALHLIHLVSRSCIKPQKILLVSWYWSRDLWNCWPRVGLSKACCYTLNAIVCNCERVVMHRAVPGVRFQQFAKWSDQVIAARSGLDKWQEQHK